MSEIFREFLKKVGSGTHTAKHLSRSEAAQATEMMLSQVATPAQIGAFAIAHRIKRPTPEELAGMLDAYDRLGPKLQALTPPPPYPVTIFGIPYDGRSRTAPVSPIVALMLAAVGVPVILHGGTRMPTKYGIPLIEIWQGLGADFTQLTLAQAQQILKTTGLGFVYLPQHFPQAHEFVPYREQIGKRPPSATAELIWSPYAGDFHLVAGYVHPPTEERFREVFRLLNIRNFTLVKGLEGSCDLPRDRTAIVSVGRPDESLSFERLKLNPRDCGFADREVPLDSPPQLFAQIRDTLNGEASALAESAIWNGGFYLWRCGVCTDLERGLARAEALLKGGDCQQKLAAIESAIAAIQ